MNLRTFTREEYQRYNLAKGSEHITSEFALLKILELIKKYRIKDILEIGLGIGTISGSILKYSRKEKLSLNVSGTEENEFCLKQLQLNLDADYKMMKCFNDVGSLPKNEIYDLIIIDGSESQLKQIKQKLKPGGLIVVEGDRANQVKTILDIFPKAKFVHVISLRRNAHYSVKNSKDYQGGLKLIFTKPDLRQTIHWFTLKVTTRLKYYKRIISHG